MNKIELCTYYSTENVSPGELMGNLHWTLRGNAKCVESVSVVGVQGEFLYKLNKVSKVTSLEQLDSM